MRARTSYIGLLLLSCLATMATGVAAQSSNKSIEDEIIRLTKAEWAAQIQKNGAAATSHMASDYTEFNADYATRLEGKEMSVRLADASYKDSGKLLASEMINPRVQVYGNVAVLSYNYVGVAQDKDGKNTPGRAKSTRVYVKQGSDWMLVHANFGADPVPENR